MDAAAGELVEFTRAWRDRHGLTRAEYTFMILRLMEVPIRMWGVEERAAADGPTERGPT